MELPSDIGVIDLMIGFHETGVTEYDAVKRLLRDADSRDVGFPAAHLFKGNVHEAPTGVDPVTVTLAEMDRHGVDIGLVNINGEVARRALVEHPARFRGSIDVDPNEITRTVKSIRDAVDEYGIKAVTAFPSGCYPQVPISDRRFYPVYQTCIDLDLTMAVSTGISGPRVPSECQHVMHFDQVCYDFPELRIVMRHGAEPWEQLAVKLMLKWPNLFYMTNAFAPKYYPRAIVDYANTRGTEKIMFAGYYPFGLTLERIFDELPSVPFRPHVWPKFLRENAIRVFNLDA